MKVLLTSLLVYMVSSLGHAQSGKQKPELFTAYFNPVETPFSRANLSAGACGAIISQADKFL